jgi:thiol peroxidase
MAQIRRSAVNWKGSPVDLEGPMLEVGDQAPDDFTVAANDLSAVTGKDLAGKPRILLAVPSLDTPVCDMEVRRFNVEVGKLPAVKVYALSMDLPFAQSRWCGAAGISDRVQTLSDYKDRSFGEAYGVRVPSLGLLARAVFVIDADDKIRHVEYVGDAVDEPDYGAALEAARAMT